MIPIGGARVGRVSRGRVDDAIPDSVVDNFESADEEPIGVYEDGETIEDYYSGATGVFERSTSDPVDGDWSLYTNHNDMELIVSTEGLNTYPEQEDTFACLWHYIGGNPVHGIQFVSTDVDNGYHAYLRPDENDFELRKISGGGSTTLATDSVSYSTGDVYDIEIEWEANDTITGRIFEWDETNSERGGQLGSWSATDSEFAEATGIGFRTGGFSGPEGQFDNYRLVE